MTPTIVAAIKDYETLQPLDSLVRDAADPPLDRPQISQPISHGQVIDISKTLCGQHSEYHLEALLQGSQIYVPPPKPKPEPTSEYKALMQRLREQEEQRAYERMTERSVAPPQQGDSWDVHQGEDEEVTYADVNRQMAVIINVLLSIVACSVAIWIAAKHWSTPQRLAISMAGSGIVGVAEVVVYAGYIKRISDSKTAEKRVGEKKEVVRTWVIGGDTTITENQGNGDIASNGKAIRRKKNKALET